MKTSSPPRLAVFLLEHFGPEFNQEALAGDLLEGLQEGRSKRWYWRQVLAAIRWRSHFYRLLMVAGFAWLCFAWNNSPVLGRLLDMAILTAGFLVIDFLPGMLRKRLRILLAVLSALFFFWLFRDHHSLYDHYSVLGFVFVNNLLFYRKAVPRRGPHLTLRELLTGDPEAERKRMIDKLDLDTVQEADPALRTAYEQAVLTLKSNQKGGSIGRGTV